MAEQPMAVQIELPSIQDHGNIGPLSEQGTMLQRCEFLERQAKTHAGNTTDLLARVDRLVESSAELESKLQTQSVNTHCVAATLMRETVSVVVHADESPEDAMLRCSQPSEFVSVPAETTIILVYPMHELQGQEVWMKNKIIDHSTGQLGWRWLRIATKQTGQHVSHFRFMV